MSLRDILQLAKNPQFWLTVSIVAGVLGLPGVEQFIGSNAVGIAQIIAALGLVFGFAASFEQRRQNAVMRSLLNDNQIDKYESIMEGK